MKSRWIAKLSDGSTVKEHEGAFKVIAGDRTPWVRLCAMLIQKGLHIQEIWLEISGEEHQILLAECYSIQYVSEVVVGESMEVHQYTDLAAHMNDKDTIHYVTDGKTLFNMEVRRDQERLAVSPKRS